MSLASHSKTLLTVSIAAWGLSLFACGGGGSPTATPTPTPATAPFLTDTFTGEIGKGGAVLVGNYTVNIAGTVTITLVSLVPQSTINMGLAIGTPAASGCNPTSAQENVSGGTVITGTMNAGTYCIVFYDVGNVSGTNTYTLTVSHF